MPADAGAAGRLALVLGGARSGKSVFAESLAAASGLSPVYIATGQAFDAEMERRIAEHQARRPPPWRTVEAPLDLVAAIEAEAADEVVILVDCLTLWITNLMLAERDLPAEFGQLAARLAAGLPGRLVFVSNEVGLSIVPDNPMAREFRDHAGRLHQTIAALADEAYVVVAGLPMKLKG